MMTVTTYSFEEVRFMLEIAQDELESVVIGLPYRDSLERDPDRSLRFSTDDFVRLSRYFQARKAFLAAKDELLERKLTLSENVVLMYASQYEIKKVKRRDRQCMTLEQKMLRKLKKKIDTNAKAP